MKKTSASVAMREMLRTSAKTFAMRLLPLDILLMVVLPLLVGGAAAFQASGGQLVDRLSVGALAVIAAYSIFVILRALVPFALRLSYADMLRLRIPFYCWQVTLVLALACASPARRLFVACDADSIQITLVLLVAASVVRFFQTGSLFRLSVAYACAGAALGLSVMGILALVLIIAVMRFLANGYFLKDGYDWNDQANDGVVDYYTNPLVGLRMKWIFLFCFIVALGLSAAFVFAPDGTLPSLATIRTLSLRGLNLDGLVIFASLGVLPLFLVLSRVRHASDTFEPLQVGETLPYVFVGVISLFVLVKPDTVTTALGLKFVVDDRLMTLLLVACVFNIVVAAMILLIDIRCRDLQGRIDFGATDRFQSQMRFTFFVASAAPFLVAAVVAFLVVRRSVPVVALLGKLVESGVEMALSPKEALMIAVDRKNYRLAEIYVRKVVADDPNDIEANVILGQRFVDEGNPQAALPYADRVYTLTSDDLRALAFVAEVYETCGNKAKTAEVRKRLAELSTKADLKEQKTQD